MRFLCSRCEWATEVELTVAPHPYLHDFTIQLNEGARQRLGEHMDQHGDWPMFPQLEDTDPVDGGEA